MPTYVVIYLLVSGTVVATHLTSEECMAGGRRCFVSLDILPQDGVVTYVSCESYLRGLKAVQQFRDYASPPATRHVKYPLSVELLAGITLMPRADHGMGTIHLALWVAPWLCLALLLTA